ncbi:MAG TPA: sulfatase [Jatrophihabitans sp.]
MKNLAALLITVLAFVLTSCGSSPPQISSLPNPPATGVSASPDHPNIVFVLTDDLAWPLVKYMPHVQALEKTGMTFTHYTVTDSLCCPSRASIFTGRFPHDTHVITNTPPNGGYAKFQQLHEDRSTFATSLFRAGYRNAFMGKYLNGYQPVASATPIQQVIHGPYVPPGWTRWVGVGPGGYSAYGYRIADGHRMRQYGHSPRDYINDFLLRRSAHYIQSASEHPDPFLLEVATFSPHKPWIPAPQDKGTFAGIRYPRTPAFNKLPFPTPRWMVGRKPVDARILANINRDWEAQVEVVQSVDRLVAGIVATLKQVGELQNTDIVFSSDNGYHLGEHTLVSGKQTAYDTDIRVPLIVSGPGIPAGSVNTDMAQNVDLRPTFEQLAGAPTPSDVEGRSLVPLLHGDQVPWRSYALIEHHRPRNLEHDPDHQGYAAGVPPSYVAIRSRTFLYVKYDTGDREYYDLVHDPYEMRDLGPSLSARKIAALDHIVARLKHCHSQGSCWRAGVPAAPSTSP